jgi:nucleoside-diphosphate-sugar epimerase
MATWVITGGAGFIGSNLAEALLARGETVRVLDDFSTGRRENLASAPQWAAAGGGRYELVEGDVRDASACAAALEGADYVLHHAAIPSVQRSLIEPVMTHEINVDGTVQLLEAARRQRVERFVFASSSAVYGEREESPQEESMAPEPISFYGLHKLAAEGYCRLYSRLYDLATVSLRYFNVFGPRQDPTSEYSAVIPRFLGAARSGRPPVVYGDGEQTRDFVFVANVVQANLLACRAPRAACGRAYNIGSGQRTSLNALLGQIGELVRRKLVVEHAAARAGDVRHSLAAIDRARVELGYEVELGLAEGLRRTLQAI